MKWFLAEKTATTIGNGAIEVYVDVAHRSNVELAFDITRKNMDLVDIMANSAGIAGSSVPLAD